MPLARNDDIVRKNLAMNIIDINQSKSGKCFINGKPIEDDNFKQTVTHLITINSDYMIKFHVNDSVEFSDYFRVVSNSKELVDELRNEYSNETYSKQFKCLGYEEENEVRQKFPLRVFELTNDFKKMINKE